MAGETTRSDLEHRHKQALEREGTRPGPVFQPDVDILEQGDAFLIYADLPGVDENHVQLRLEQGVLSIDAELATRPEAAWSPIHAEYHLGSFHREFRISEEIDTSSVKASMRDGVLELRLPKLAKQEPRRIPVTGG